MKQRLLVIIILLAPLLLLAAPRYDIRGDSPLLDANLSRYLQQWRTETSRPIQEGDYTNIRLCADCGEEKRIALTFDDSPDENNTFAVLEILERYNVKASFFMIASTMNDINASAVQRAHAEGHLILNHSFTHPRFTSCTPEQLIGEARAAGERIHALIGKTPALLRPPYGSLNRNVVDTLNAQGYTTVLWSLDSLDWALSDPDAITGNVISNVRPGDVILMHSSRSNGATVSALPGIIVKLAEMGYRFETLDRLLRVEPYR